jgi:cytochrome c oxidase subunit 2
MQQGERPRRDRRDEVTVGIVWAVLTVGGELIVWLWLRGIMPERYAETSAIVDDAFIWLTAFAVPVFAFVFAFLGVSLVRHRRRAGEEVDGEPIHGSRPVYKAWFAVTGGLCALLLVFPGFIGLSELHRAGMPEHGAEHDPVLVQMQAAKWAWTATYGEDISVGDELVLPAERQVEFEVTSVDVLHSFWIPAFRVKIDAVPGQTTRVAFTPERPGSFAEDQLMRLQCAELCGLHHSTMAMPVRVVAAAEFEAWLEGKAGPACESDGSTELHISAKDTMFDTSCMAVPADEPFRIVFENREAVPHNVAIATDSSWSQVLFTGEIVTGPTTVTYEVPAMEAGLFAFRCDVHPGMNGQFVVEGED